MSKLSARSSCNINKHQYGSNGDKPNRTDNTTVTLFTVFCFYLGHDYIKSN